MFEDEKEFEAFYKKHHRNRRYFIYQIVKNWDDADDILADSFITLWENRDKCKFEKEAMNYLIAITVNKSINFLKAKRNMGIRNQRYWDEIDQIIEPIEIKSDLFQMIIKQTRWLPPKRKAIFMKWWGGVAYEHIAQAFNISIDTARVQVKRSLNKLKDIIHDKEGVVPEIKRELELKREHTKPLLLKSEKTKEFLKTYFPCGHDRIKSNMQSYFNKNMTLVNRCKACQNNRLIRYNKQKTQDKRLKPAI